jgi:uncharacterized membrane protein YphA (DoxX/SURF4 family)
MAIWLGVAIRLGIPLPTGPMMALGAVSPPASGGYSVTVFFFWLATHRSPSWSKARPTGPWSGLVLLPSIVATGVASPPASGAYSVTELLA